MLLHRIFTFILATVIKDAWAITLANKQITVTRHGYSKSWNEANAICDANGGSLWSEDSLERTNVIQTYAPGWSKVDLWFGLHYPPSESSDEYGWTDCYAQDLSVYTHWKSAEPKMSSGQRCAFIDKNGGTWITASCETSLGFVCMNEGAPCTFTTGSGLPVASTDYESLTVNVPDVDACKTRCLIQVYNFKNCWAINFESTSCILYYTFEPFIFSSLSRNSDSIAFHQKECYTQAAVDSDTTSISATSNSEPSSGCSIFNSQTTPTTFAPTTPTTTSTAAPTTSTSAPTTTSTSTAAPTTTTTSTPAPTTTSTSTPAPTTTSTSIAAPTTTSTSTAAPTTTSTSTAAPITTSTSTAAPNTTSTSTSAPTTTSTSTAAPTTTSTSTSAPTTTSTSTSAPTTTSTSTAAPTTTSTSTAALTTSTAVTLTTSQATPHPGTTVSTSTPSSMSSTTRSICLCDCNSITSSTANLTLDEKLELIRLKLKIDIKKLSSTVRKKTSAKDNRTSAKSVGYVAIIFICLEASCFVIPDFISALRYVLDRFSKTRPNVITNE